MSKNRIIRNYKLPSDFNIYYYKLLNNDLINFSDEELKSHYYLYGQSESRLYKYNLPIDFNIQHYKLLNKDLINFTDEEIIKHYLSHGENENRIYKCELPENFNVDNYRLLNKDIENLTNSELEIHYFTKGQYQNRLYNFDLPDDFNVDDYRLLNSSLKDLSDDELKIHYFLYGQYENIPYKYDLPKISDNIDNFLSDTVSIVICLSYGQYGTYLAKSISHILNKLNIKNKVIDHLTQNDIDQNINKPNEYFLILFYNVLTITPTKNKYILYQLEQVNQSKWINENYLNGIKNSIITIDYSKENIRALLKINDNLKNKIYYQPLPLNYSKYIYHYTNLFNDINLNENEYDILFFGNFNIRRDNILNYLKDRYNIKIVDKVFGVELNNLIKKSRIIINIHYYYNAILEIYRINEILEYNKIIISELPISSDYENKKLYEKNIIFIDEIKDDLSNIDNLCDKINYLLDNNNYCNFIQNNLNSINYIYNFTNNLFINNLKKFNFNILKNNFKSEYISTNNEDLLKINFIDYILWINMDSSKNRYYYMKNLLLNLNVENSRISAIDGKKNKNLKDAINIEFERNLSNYEIACTLSHIKSINYLNNFKGDYFMICEDDIAFTNLKYFNHDLKKIISDAPEFDILLLFKSSILNYDNNKYIKWNEDVFGTVCYIVSRSGINKLISFAKYDFINKNFDFDKNIKFDVADIFIYNRLNTFVYKYNFISTKFEESTIHPDHLEGHKLNNELHVNLILNDYC